MNNVVVTVLYLLRVLHRPIIVYRILYKNQRIRASLATAIYEKKTSQTVYYLGRMGCFKMIQNDTVSQPIIYITFFCNAI